MQSLAHKRHHYSRFSPGVQPGPISDGARSGDSKAGRLPRALLRQAPSYFAWLIFRLPEEGAENCTMGAAAGQPGAPVPALPGGWGLWVAGCVTRPGRAARAAAAPRGAGAVPVPGPARAGSGPVRGRARRGGAGGAATAPPAPSAIGGAGPAGAGGRDSGGEPGPSEPRSPLSSAPLRTAVPWWGITAASPVNGPCSPRVPSPD